MVEFDYGAAAELFSTRKRMARRQAFGYKRFAQASDAIRFAMEDLPPESLLGAYLEVDKPTRLVMSWRWTHRGEPEEAGEESRVEVDLRPIDTGTELTFTHSRLRTEASRASHEQGWNGALDKLARHFANDRT